MRVEYAINIDCTFKYQYIGFIKGWRKKFFRIYVDICEISTRRIDSVPLKDIFGEIGPRDPSKPKNTTTINNHED